MLDLTPTPPEAKRVPHVHEAHGDRRVDDYHWMRNREDPDVVAYLEAENVYTDAVMAPTRDLQERLYAEIVSRIQETDLSVAVPHGPFRYYSRSVEGLQYHVYCRRPGDAPEGPGDRGVPEDPGVRGVPEDTAEAVLLDHNAEAEGHEYCEIGLFEVSPDHRLLAWSIDTDGDEEYLLRVRDLEEGADWADAIPGTYYGAAWGSDNRTLFYATLDDAHRPWRIWRHVLGTDPADDVLVHQEDDERFFASVERTRSGGFIAINLHSATTSEVRVLDAREPEGEFRVIEPRRQDVEYFVDHAVVGGTPGPGGDRFFILANDDAPNFRLVEAPVEDPGRSAWRELIAHRSDVKLEGVDAFAGHLVVLERAEAVRRLRVLDLETGEEHLVTQPEAVSRVSVSESLNPEFHTTTLRYTYTSLVTPQSVYAYDLVTRERELLKQEPVLGGYDPSEYVTERLWATAPDGARIPISAVRRADTPVDGTAPALLYGYGSYEACSDPSFSSLRLSLLDRGMTFAIAHIRGGGEMGRPWYEAGKLHHKTNTFTDFIACGERLIEAGWAAPDRLVILGGSAGGLLVGAVLNLRPDLFAGAVAEVPFVDVVSTISDPTLPLSVIEWEEWGNPADPDFYTTMKSYSPYDNVAPQTYPALLVTAGLNDPRVSYWEPAKWVARLRATRKGDAPLVLRTEMGSGHGGPSGRYDAWRKEAFTFAFLLAAAGVEE